MFSIQEGLPLSPQPPPPCRSPYRAPSVMKERGDVLSPGLAMFFPLASPSALPEGGAGQGARADLRDGQAGRRRGGTNRTSLVPLLVLSGHGQKTRETQRCSPHPGPHPVRDPFSLVSTGEGRDVSDWYGVWDAKCPVSTWGEGWRPPLLVPCARHGLGPPPRPPSLLFSLPFSLV